MPTPVRLLLDSITSAFAATSAPDNVRQDAITKTLAMIDHLDLSPLDTPQDEHVFDGVHHLDVPLAQMRDDARPYIAMVAAALDAAKLQLPWRVAHAHYYPEGANPGPGYLATNISCELIGPEAAPVYAPDFRLGLFYFGPHVLYRDHAHLAPELYVTMAGPSQWRQDCGSWVEKHAGSVMFNTPNQPHAMQTDAMPFFAIFVWLQDVHDKIALVPMDDWDAIEGALAQKS